MKNRLSGDTPGLFDGADALRPVQYPELEIEHHELLRERLEYYHKVKQEAYDTEVTHGTKEYQEVTYTERAAQMFINIYEHLLHAKPVARETNDHIIQPSLGFGSIAGDIDRYCAAEKITREKFFERVKESLQERFVARRGNDLDTLVELAAAFEQNVEWALSTRRAPENAPAR